jgi:hypothetical protein
MYDTMKYNNTFPFNNFQYNPLILPPFHLDLSTQPYRSNLPGTPGELAATLRPGQLAATPRPGHPNLPGTPGQFATPCKVALISPGLPGNWPRPFAPGNPRSL